MEEMKQKAKQLILDSPAGKMVELEKIEEIFNNIVMIPSQEEFKRLCVQYGVNPRMQASAFTNGEVIYIGPEEDAEKLIHNIVHESMHRMSKRWDKDGKLVQNGMQCAKGQRFSNFVNEGVTDYLTKRIVGENNCQYVHEARVIEALDEEMVKYFEDPDVLFSLYLQDDNTGLENKRFKEFLDSTRGKGSYDELYENISFMNVNEEKTQKYLGQVKKGVKSRVRRKKIKKLIDKIADVFGGKRNSQLLSEKSQTRIESSESSLSYSRIIGNLHGQVNEIYEEFPPKPPREKEDLHI